MTPDETFKQAYDILIKKYGKERVDFMQLTDYRLLKEIQKRIPKWDAWAKGEEIRHKAKVLGII